MNNKVDGYFLTALAAILAVSTWFDYQREPEVKRKEVAEVIKVVEVKEVAIPDNRPDFAAMTDVKQKKHQFFTFIRIMVEEENSRLQNIRRQLENYQAKPALSAEEQSWVIETAKKFRVASVLKGQKTVDAALFQDLLMRVDSIPVSLALVQAANESAWGTSRFALKANNYFGQWCFTKDCGLVPAARPQGATYEVRKFATPAYSVRSYMNNLNTSHHYAGLREIRAKARLSEAPVTGPMLAQGLYAYSERGVAYVEELVAMINSNDLLRYDLGEEK